MKWLCNYHERNPDQTGSMSCPDCNTCDNCGKIYYEGEEPDNRCPYCGEPGY